MSPWISVKERLPKNGTHVLAWYAGPIGWEATVAFIENSHPHRGLVRTSDGAETDATHWMPLPDPPSTQPTFGQDL